MTRVVVVGNGMVGSRFVEDLARHGDRFRVTVLGAEEYEPYNRVLLSEVVAGKVDVASLTLPRAALRGVTVQPGAEVVAVDRAARSVTSADGRHVGYDVLVLATGARAVVPEIAGLGGVAGVAALPAGVHALRTLDDAREIVAATVNARRAVVLGAGVLGLEAACGLARRGLPVTVVHRGEHLMDRQLDAEAAAAVGHGLRLLGIDHRVGAHAREVLISGGHARGVLLGDGEELAADLILLAAGTVPEAGLAARAGLEVRRGVVVGADGATADPAVFAIGDCAEPPGGGTGLIAQGWDQARRLAVLLAGGGEAGGGPADRLGTGSGSGSVDSPPGSPAAHGTDVVRLKAHGLEVVTMGVSGGRRGAAVGHRSVRLSDPAAGRHVEVVVADGVVVGVTCVGAGAVTADLTTAYLRRIPAPADPAQLLLRPVRGATQGVEPSATLMPDRATVCRCNGVTKGDLVACWHGGARTVAEVARATRATTGCGGCVDAVCGLLDWLGRAAEPERGHTPVDDPGSGHATVAAGAPGAASVAAPAPTAAPAPAVTV